MRAINGCLRAIKMKCVRLSPTCVRLIQNACDKILFACVQQKVSKTDGHKLFTFSSNERFNGERGRLIMKETGVQWKNEQFSLLVKRARQQALLKSILISVGTSLVFHYLIRRKGGNDVEI